MAEGLLFGCFFGGPGFRAERFGVQASVSTSEPLRFSTADGFLASFVGCRAGVGSQGSVAFALACQGFIAAS